MVGAAAVCCLACDAAALPSPALAPSWLTPAAVACLPHRVLAPAEGRDPFRGNTVRAAFGLQQNAVLERLLAVVLTVRKCHSGEAFVRLKVRGLRPRA